VFIGDRLVLVLNQSVEKSHKNTKMIFFPRSILYSNFFIFLWQSFHTTFWSILGFLFETPELLCDGNIWRGIIIPTRIILEISDLALDNWERGAWPNRDIYDLRNFRQIQHKGDLPVFQWCPQWGHNQNPNHHKMLLGFWAHDSYKNSDWLTWSEYNYLINFQNKMYTDRSHYIRWAVLDHVNQPNDHLKKQILHNIVMWPE